MSDFGEPATFLPLQQSRPYAEAVAACGARVRWLEGEAGPVLAVERGRLRLISRVAGVGGLRRLARWPGLTLLTPEAGVAGFGLVPLVTPLHHAVWRLGPELRAPMAGNWRNHLAAAERRGVQVVRGGRATLERLLAEDSRQRRLRGYRALPPGFSLALPERSLRHWEWRQAGETGAAMSFVVHGATASYHLAWASDAARAASVHQLMLTRAAEALWLEGVRWLDLGSVDSERAPGLARFKLGTGAGLRRLGATCLLLP